MENSGGKRSLGRSKRRCKTTTKTDLNGTDGRVWTGLFWLKTGTNKMLLQTQYMNRKVKVKVPPFIGY